MKLNLVIDASGIFYRSLFAMGNFGLKKGERMLDSQESCGIFMRKLSADFSALIRSMDDIDRVIVCLDSSSWRKEVEIEDGGYKSNRTHDDSSINWEMFYKLSEEFHKLLQKKGFLISKINKAEGDDLLFLWSRKLNDIGECVIMVVGDRDLLQTVQKHENGSWTVALDPVAKRRKVFLDQETYDLSLVKKDETDFFSYFNEPQNDILQNLLSKEDYEIVNPHDFASKKVLLGDSGDAVPGVISWKDPKNPEKIRSLTAPKIQKVLENVEFDWKDKDDKKLTILCENFNKIQKNIVITEEQLLSNIRRNIKLMILDKSTIPQDIQDAFEHKTVSIPDSRTIITRENILEGTEWWDKKKQFVPSSVGINFSEANESEPIKIIKKSEPLF